MSLKKNQMEKKLETHTKRNNKLHEKNETNPNLTLTL